VAVLAEALARRHQVEIIHHKPCMDSKRLGEISNTDLRAVRMRYVTENPYSFGTGHNPVRRYNNARLWQSDLSEPYDLFINFTHGFPPFCHARLGALVVLFPFHNRPHKDATNTQVRDVAVWRRLKNTYNEWEWRARLDSYRIKTTISRFSQEWTSRRWGIDCEVIYPPADASFRPGEKKHAVLSVGRFTATGHSKKQLEMMAAFGDLHRSTDSCLEYFSVGGVSDADADFEYFQRVGCAAIKCGGKVMANVDRRNLKRLYERARVFWHAAGYGEIDERPELTEHFGIATVEAMAAGCVPIVINKGGQPEIVQHGINGFLWNTLDELKEYTSLVIRDDGLCARMAEAARARAADFSRERFLRRFRAVLQGEKRLGPV
jgi:glycosyltransferase involved in cell wall biosynthesis